MEQINLNEVSNAFVVEAEPSVAVNGSKFKRVKLNGGHAGILFSTKIGVDEKGQDVFSDYTGDVKVILTSPLAIGKVKVLGKEYDLVEKELKKEDGSKYKIKSLINADGIEVGRYSKAYRKIGKKIEFFRNKWQVRFDVYTA